MGAILCSTSLRMSKSSAVWGLSRRWKPAWYWGYKLAEEAGGWYATVWGAKWPATWGISISTSPQLVPLAVGV